jgi:hypothetical protein
LDRSAMGFAKSSTHPTKALQGGQRKRAHRHA